MRPVSCHTWKTTVASLDCHPVRIGIFSCVLRPRIFSFDDILLRNHDAKKNTGSGVFEPSLFGRFSFGIGSWPSDPSGTSRYSVSLLLLSGRQITPSTAQAGRKYFCFRR